MKYFVKHSMVDNKMFNNVKILDEQILNDTNTNNNKLTDDDVDDFIESFDMSYSEGKLLKNLVRLCKLRQSATPNSDGLHEAEKLKNCADKIYDKILLKSTITKLECEIIEPLSDLTRSAVNNTNDVNRVMFDETRNVMEPSKSDSFSFVRDTGIINAGPGNINCGYTSGTGINPGSIAASVPFNNISRIINPGNIATGSVVFNSIPSIVTHDSIKYIPSNQTINISSDQNINFDSVKYVNIGGHFYAQVG